MIIAEKHKKRPIKCLECKRVVVAGKGDVSGINTFELLDKLLIDNEFQFCLCDACSITSGLFSFLAILKSGTETDDVIQGALEAAICYMHEKWIDSKKEKEKK